MAIKDLRAELIPRLKKLKIKARKDVYNKALEGNWTTVFKGQGMEFAGYRAYTFSDDASKIDWAASLRAHETLVRDLEEMHSFNIFFLVDISDSMLFSSTNKLKAEYTAEVVYNLAHSIIQSGDDDAIGMGLFNEKLIKTIPPSTGKETFYRIVKELTDPVNYGGGFDFTKSISYVRSFLKDKSLIIIISDFIGLSKGWSRYLNILSGRYDVIGIMVRDPRDSFIPKNAGQYLVEDPFTGEKLYIDTHQYFKLFANEAERQENFVRNSFEKAKLGFISLKTNQEFNQPLMDYFRKRLSVVK